MSTVKDKNAFNLFMTDMWEEFANISGQEISNDTHVASALKAFWLTLEPHERAIYYKPPPRMERIEIPSADETETLGDISAMNITIPTQPDQESPNEVLQSGSGEQEDEIVNTQADVENIVNNLTINSDSPPENRNFIVLRFTHMVIPNSTDPVWPLEFAFVAFNMKDGMKDVYWGLIDTGPVPQGSEPIALSLRISTDLPRPPDEDFYNEEHRDYKQILLNIKLFVEKFLDDYGEMYILFAMDCDLMSVQCCLLWLYSKARMNNSLTEEENETIHTFFKKLEFSKLESLLLNFTTIARRQDPGYFPWVEQFKEKEKGASVLLNQNPFTFQSTVGCPFHQKAPHSLKIHVCSQTKVLKRVYLILGEITPKLKIKKCHGHLIELFKNGEQRASSNTPEHEELIDLDLPDAIIDMERS